MALSLHHIVIDAHDLARLARFWSQVLGWRILSERDREVVIGSDERAPLGICFMPPCAFPVVSAPLDAFRAGEDLVRDPAQVVLQQLVEVEAPR